MPKKLKEISRETDESRVVLDKLVDAVALLCIETATLVDDSASRVQPGYVAGVRRAANKLREVGQELRIAADTSLRTPDQQKPDSPKPEQGFQTRVLP